MFFEIFPIIAIIYGIGSFMIYIFMDRKSKLSKKDLKTLKAITYINIVASLILIVFVFVSLVDNIFSNYTEQTAQDKILNYTAIILSITFLYQIFALIKRVKSDNSEIN